MTDCYRLAEDAAGLLAERNETVAVAESSSGGLISASLLAVPGASRFFLGGNVVYTGRALKVLSPGGAAQLRAQGMRSSSEPYAAWLAQEVRQAHRATWGLSETGAAGPTGNGYGDAAGHTCFAVDGALQAVHTLETGMPDRMANMYAFAGATLSLLIETLRRA